MPSFAYLSAVLRWEEYPVDGISSFGGTKVTGFVGRWSCTHMVGRAYHRITLYLAEDRDGPSFGLVCKVVGSVVIEVLYGVLRSGQNTDKSRTRPVDSENARSQFHVKK